MRTRIRVAFTGGGTGGHIYPALAIDDALQRAFAGERYDRRYFGNRLGLEAKLVQTIPLIFIASAPLRRALSFALFSIVWQNLAGVLTAFSALRKYRPMVLIATGGYVCFPVVVAARLLCWFGLLACRIALLEINAQPGLTNRLLGPLVDEVWTTYADSRRYFRTKTVRTGTPVRSGFKQLRPAAAARRAIGLADDRATIVVMGGSQGARTINEAVATLITQYSLPPTWQILHVSGERDYLVTRVREKAPAAGNRIRLVAYLDDPVDAYAAADVIIARAGASTLAELCVTATPAILVPYPFAADDHQSKNAALVAAAGAAVVVADSDCSAETLLVTLNAVLDTERLSAMRAAAAELIPTDAVTTIVARVSALLAPRVNVPLESNATARD